MTPSPQDELFFIEPDGSNREAARRLGYRIVDLLVDSAADASGRAPLDRDVAQPQSGYIPSREGRSLDSLFPELERFVRHGMNPSHPGYLGHMDTIGSAIGAFSDAIVSGLNNNMLAFEMSPVWSELERRLMSWATRLFNLGEDDSPRTGISRPTGSLVSGGTLANMTALLVARNALGGSLRAERGLGSDPSTLCFIASEHGHYSFQKAANLLGLGREGWVRAPADRHGRVQVEAMERIVRDLRDAGRTPFALVGIAGTTVTASIDPLREIGALARREGLWFHVDAAYGGAIALSPALRPKLDGIEAADSVTFNPQKWMYVPKVCASILFRDERDVEKHLREDFLYGNSNRKTTGERAVNLGEYTLQGTRRVDALKLYLTLEHLGTARIAGWIEGHVALAKRMSSRIESEPALELLQHPYLNIVGFRHLGGRAPDDPTLDAHTRAIQERIEEEGRTWLSLPHYLGRKWLRAVILHPRASAEQLERVVDDVLRIGREV